MNKKINIIDLFSGPGGLGEGFSNCKKNSPFEIAMSVEAEKNAHKTLTHRAFYRKLNQKGKSRFLDYIQCIDHKERKCILDDLKETYNDIWELANKETMNAPHTLGNKIVWDKIKEGEKITAKDRKDTPQQIAISKRVQQIKNDSIANNEPLIVIGGPPCQSYSTAGRPRVQAIKEYVSDEDQRFFLYREFCRVLSEAEPEMFIMENVEGILSAKLANGDKIFPHVIEALENPSQIINQSKGASYNLYSLIKSPDSDEDKPIYKNPADFNIKINKFGIPQKRHRIIILGVKNDLKKVTKFMKHCVKDCTISISDLINTMPHLRSGISNRNVPVEIDNTYENWLDQWNISKNLILNELNKLNEPEYKKIIKVIKMSSRKTNDELDQGNDIFVQSTKTGFSKRFNSSELREEKELRNWIAQPKLSGFANHSTKSHKLHDRQIYMFTSAWAKAYSNTESPSPKSKDFPSFLAPNHKNWESGHHADRFRCIESSKVAPTVTSHLKKDGHAFIHYDIHQNRALTVREAARIQTFPDDYFFEGTQGAQYQQVGNAVPPFLAKKIALHVLKLIRENGLI